MRRRRCRWWSRCSRHLFTMSGSPLLTASCTTGGGGGGGVRGFWGKVIDHCGKRVVEKKYYYHGITFHLIIQHHSPHNPPPSTSQTTTIHLTNHHHPPHKPHQTTTQKPVQFLEFSARAEAPCSRRMRQLSKWPREMERWRGVRPCGSLSSKSYSPWVFSITAILSFIQFSSCG